MQAQALIAWNPEPARLYCDTNYLSQTIHDSLDSWRFEQASAYDNFNATRAKVTTMDARLIRRNVPTAFPNLSGLTFGGGKSHASSHLFFVMDTPGQRGVYDHANTVTGCLFYCVPTALLLDQAVETLIPDLPKQMHAEKLERLPHVAVEEQKCVK
eukprot:6210312-Pleurochrysis_carterae.AAC.3